METQKVEIELPVFDGYEFVGYRINTILDENLYVLRRDALGDYELVKQDEISNVTNIRYFFYRKKQKRRIIFEETVVDYVEPGELFMDDFGMPNIWEGKGPSFMKAPKLKKIQDDFEVNNG